MSALHILTGCTASGKSALALERALKNSAEILSCDALLFYQGMDIGTAKPSLQERSLVPHHGIDLVSIEDTFDIDRYQHYAKATIEAILARGKQVIITGGSGFYLKCFWAPVVDGIHVSPEVREAVTRISDASGLPGLIAELAKHNPNEPLASLLDIHNPRRVTRALERCLASGKTISQLHKEFAAMPSLFQHYPIHIECIEHEDSILKTRIQKRTQKMLAAGLIEEVQTLLQQGLLKNPSASRSIGYAQTIEWLNNGHSDTDTLAQSINIATWHLVRKQRTWFRHQLPLRTSLM